MAEDIKQYNYEDWQSNSTRAYGKILSSQLRDRTAGQRYRQEAYDRIAGTTRAAEQGIKDTSVQAYGMNNPSGTTGALIAQQRAKAPYASADLAAREAGRQSAISTGNALIAKKQAQANWYSTMIAPYLHEQDTQAGLAVGLANAEALGAQADAAVSAAKIGANAQIIGSIIGAL